MGPNESGNYYELTCQGIDKVTSEFKQYDLSEIIREFEDNTDPELASEPTPPYIGGLDVKLLIGIKNTNLNPILLKILPSGIAVYRSPFRDVWGSRLIFAGPHSSFTKTNGGTKTNVSNAIFHMKQNSEIKPWEEKQIPFSVVVEKCFNISIHPRPLDKQAIINAGGGMIEIEEPPLIVDVEYEGLKTQDMEGAPERHASHHGVPDHVYADNGTQLLCLKQAKFSIRDIDAQLHESLGLESS